MLTLTEIADWLAGLMTGATVYCGFIDANDLQCIGVYDRDTGTRRQTIGQESAFQNYSCKVLVHWSKNITTCETEAQLIYTTLLANRKSSINGHALIDIQMERPKPINVGRDDNGIWESVIPMTIIYEV